MLIGRRNVEGGGRQDTFHNDRVPRCGRHPRRNLRELGLRRERAVLEGELRGPHAEPLRSGAQSARDRRQSSTRIRPARPSVRSRSAARSSTARIRTACRTTSSISRNPPTQAALDYLQAPTISIGPDRPGDLHRHRHGRPGRNRAAEPLRGRGPSARRRHRAPQRSGGVRARPAAADAGHRRPGRPRHPAERQRQGDGLLRRAAGPAGAGCPIRRSAEPGHGLSLLGLRGPDDRHLQDRDGLGADRGHPVPRQLPARGSRGERDRAVHRTGLQSVRRDTRHRSVRPRTDCDAPAVPRYGRS